VVFLLVLQEKIHPLRESKRKKKRRSLDRKPQPWVRGQS
jgi:hypothetical protein